MTPRRAVLVVAAVFLLTVVLVVQASARVVWDPLADCESGLRDHGRVVAGSARWHIHDRVHQGGLQFSVYTWDAYVAKGKPYQLVGFPADAHLATRAQQIVVAVRVRDGVKGSSRPYLNAQGYGAWPKCSRIVGLR